MSIDEIMLIVSSGIALLSIVFNIIIYIKKAKLAKQNGITLEENAISEIINKLPKFIADAEQIFGSGTGLAKLSYVLDKVQLECVKSNVTFDERYMTEQIENILSTPEKKEGV